MASSGTRAVAAAALLFSFSAVVFLFLLLQAPPPGLGLTADLLASALDRFLDGRGGLLELATRRNMILLCHAILLLILRDAGVLGAPASRRSRSRPGEATAAPARPRATRSPAAAQGEEAAAVATKQIVVVESARDDDDDLLDRHDRDAVVEPLEHPTAIAADDAKRMDDQTAGMEMEMELADDRTFEEFIKSQRRKMRQESLHYQAIATCYH
ncbi:unnamed protein product [Miscanthus lutarioriparius]|uniref:Uncharacterized protein n=1 Tax=Miscanthus lutarioriparius TaxID=422564 RepID=A0A811NDQ5_9POAL|nr:unnamed protein product [Miscanthus lutarioriparius]